MSHYEEMTPVVVEDAWTWANSQYQGWQLSMRKCPKCGYLLGTNHKGAFACNREGCGYRDEQDVSHLAKLGWRNETHRLRMRYGRRAV
jgi:ribosomal protein S27AE